MNEEALNLSIRKFLKMVGISSQREIEHAVAKATATSAALFSRLFARCVLAGANKII